MSNVAGEDRSSFQAVTSWTGASFGFAKAAEGTGWRDPTFAANWRNLKAQVPVRGAYHFFHPADDPLEQARFFCSVVRANGGFEPGDVAIGDIEITAGADGLEAHGTPRSPLRAHEGLRATAPEGFSPAMVGTSALAYLHEVERLAGAGVRVLLYTDRVMAQGVLAGCTAYDLFIAYYSAREPGVAPWRRWTFWQNGARGPGGGDLDYFNGDAAALARWAAPELPPDWTYPPVRNLTGRGGKTTAVLTWSAPAQPSGTAPLPAISEYEIAIAAGETIDTPEVKTYPRYRAKGTNPETWEGGSLPPGTHCAGVRALGPDGHHAGPWATVLVTVG